MFFEKYKLVVVLILVVILCAICASNYHHQSAALERFSQATDTQMSYITKKSNTYFPYISDFFYSNKGATNDIVSIKNQVFSFLPSFADGMCSYIDPVPSSCTNFYVNNISLADNYEYISPIQCRNVETTIGMDKSQCTARVLNNLYTCRKKCIRFNSASNQLNSLYLSNLSLSTTSTSSNYTCTIFSSNTSELNLLVLLRPSLISFGNFGLYKINPLEGSANLFNNYSTLSNVNQFKFNMTDINNLPQSQSTVSIYPKIQPNANFYYMFRNNVGSNWNIMANIYYLNYEQPSYSAAATSNYNTLSFIVDNQYVSNTYNSDIATSSTITLQNANIAKLCSSIKYTFDFTNYTNNNFNFFTLQISYAGANSGTQMSFPVHRDFSELISNYMKNASSKDKFLANTDIGYHIVTIYSLDLIIILSLLKDFTTNKTYMFYTQNQVANNGSPIYMQYVGDPYGRIKDNSAQGFTNDGVMNNHYKKFSNMCPNSGIPNLAIVAKSLGYDV
jgi:hypothetical protein